MATITLDLPDWCDERHIYVFAGMELVAYKAAGTEKVLQKVVRCNSCGKCCSSLNDKFHFLTIDEACAHLRKDGEKAYCGESIYRPFQCCWSDPVLCKEPNAENFCCVRYEEK